MADVNLEAGHKAEKFVFQVTKSTLNEVPQRVLKDLEGKEWAAEVAS